MDALGQAAALVHDHLAAAMAPLGNVPVVQAMRFAVAGGKGLRGYLVLESAALHGVGRASALPAAAAVEALHAYSLVHDDLPAMDDDDLRRGRPTSHKVFGEALAILAGDALLTEAFALLALGPEPLRGVLCGELSCAAGAGGMVGGQVLDVAADRPPRLDYLSALHRMKTGALIRAACRMGTLAGGGAPLQVEAAGAYGEAVGLAFQIADDLLDVTATSEQLGKPTGADAAAGRVTYPALLGLEGARKLALEQVELALGAVRLLEPSPGRLALLARYSVERGA